MLQHLLKILSCIGFFHLRDFFRCSFGNYISAPVAALRSEVDNVVSLFYDIQIVFNNDYRVAFVDKSVQYVQQLLNIGKMKSCCRLVEDVESASSASL